MAEPATEYLPLSHGVQVEAPLARLVIEPAAHASHAERPLDDENLPASHDKHCVSEPEGEYFPAGHTVQDDAALRVFVIDPALHMSHDELAAPAAYEPVAQALHSVAEPDEE